jgi:hypothetical protein
MPFMVCQRVEQMRHLQAAVKKMALMRTSVRVLRGKVVEVG